MSLITTIIDGLAPNPSTGLGGANEGYIQGFQDDILTGVAGGVANKADGQCLVTENDPNGMSVLVADGVVYVPNADYIAGLASTTKFYRVVIKDEDPLTIASNGGATWRLDGIDVVIDKEVVPNEYGSNVATLVVTQGTGEDEPAVPDNGYRLAVVQVDAGETQIVDADIQDVRTQISIDMDVLSTNIVTKTDTQTLTNKTLTSPVINTSFSGTAKATASEVATGTNDTKIVTPLSAAAYGNSSMARQAIINGNFTVWQRGVTRTDTTPASFLLADHWQSINDPGGGGTQPTLVTSQQAITPGELDGSNYFYRLAPNGAGTLGTSRYHVILQKIENGTRLLCGASKKVTVSFYARSSIAGKRLGLYLVQNYGTGGSPTAQETIAGSNWTLTSTWTKYSYTLTTNTLVGKTFGTNKDDSLFVLFNHIWNVNSTPVNATTEETYVGSGNIDIAQVQLCAGDVALPFQPKSEDEERDACLRYCWVPDEGGVAVDIAQGQAFGTTGASILFKFPKRMRVAPNLTATAGDWKLNDPSTGTVDVTSIAIDGTNTIKTREFANVAVGVASGLTANRPYLFRSDGGGTRVMIFDAEL